jgi:transcriptional regulator with XRE-family HTH domain
MTQRELAEQAGISPTMLSQLLTGQRYAGPSVRSRLLSTPLLKPPGYDGLFQVEG